MWWTTWQRRSNIPARELGVAQGPLPVGIRPAAKFTIGGGIRERVVNDAQRRARATVEPQMRLLGPSDFAQSEPIRHLDGDLSLPDTAPTSPASGTGTRPGFVDVLVGIFNAAVSKATYGLVRNTIQLPAAGPAPTAAADPSSGDLGADYNPDTGPMIGGVSAGEIKASDLTGGRIGETELAGPEDTGGGYTEHGFGSSAGEKI